MSADRVQIVEVGPRDGLQNEASPVPTDAKLAFIQSLAAAGLTRIEATSFVSPKWVPQLADADALWPRLPEGPRYEALVPNLRGLERALPLGVRRISLFTAASEAFTLRNINMTIAQSLEVSREVVEAFRARVPGGFVRGYVSTVIACPFAGPIAVDQVEPVVRALFALGVDEVSLGDTIGVGSPREVRTLGEAAWDWVDGPSDRLAWHFHDTWGTALANVSTALEQGYRIFDASAAGLGGCPYAPGAGGNLATEDLAYLLSREGFATGLDLRQLATASQPVLEALGRTTRSRAGEALASSPE